MLTVENSLRRAIQTVLVPARYGGGRYECSCCGGRFRALQTFRGREHARCPRCGSLERHRMMCLYLSRARGLLSDSTQLLHFAPEPAVEGFLRRCVPSLGYTSADAQPGRAMTTMDITAMASGEARFDLVLCSHVLEHVPDDRRAMKEIFRVLRPRGLAILQQPVDQGRAVTYEDWTITAPDERRRAFGQDDHVRVYGLDFPTRLEESGFTVDVVRSTEHLPAREVERYRVRAPLDDRLNGSDLYLARKP
jgi:SAM-dependent methyltransferase